MGISRFRTVDVGPRQWSIETDNLRAVLGFRGKVSDWDWEVGLQRARSESLQTGNRHQGWVRTDFLQTELTAGTYNPFGGTINPAGRDRPDHDQPRAPGQFRPDDVRRPDHRPAVRCCRVAR